MHASSTLEKSSTVYLDKKLFDKQRKEGVQGRVLDVLIFMYSNDKSAVKIDNKLTEALTCFARVKQGCTMSPTLFNFYLSDLPKFLNMTSSTDITLGDRSITVSYMRMM